MCIRDRNKKVNFVYAETKYPLENIVKKYILEAEPEKEKSPTDIKEENDWDERCQLCREWCQLTQCLKCDECAASVHLYCLDPPLERKPNKDVVWVCFNCLKKQEGTPEALKNLKEEQELDQKFIQDTKLKVNQVAMDAIHSGIDHNKDNCWFQYLGQHMVSRMEDVLDESLFLPYPFKCSRVGVKYQWSESLVPWKIKPYNSENELERGTENTATLLWKFDPSRISLLELESYFQRCKEAIPKNLSIEPESCNFLDYVIQILVTNEYDTETSFKAVEANATRELLEEPTFTSAEMQRFESAVRKYGSQLRPVWKEVETQPMSMIVRFYYNWKKTTRGLQVRGKSHKKIQSSKRIQKKHEHGMTKIDHLPEELEHINKPAPQHTTEPEYKYIDDSSFETERLSLSGTIFKCLFCETNYSPMWYKVTGGTDDEHIKTRLQTGVNEKTETSEKDPSSKKDDSPLGALCIRCARLWRRYAIKWQPPLDILKKLAGTSMSTFHSNIGAVLEESNINAFFSSPKLAHMKGLEWELVQDSELITRQRLKIMQDPKEIQKRRRYATRFHTLLYRMVERPYDKNAYLPETMKIDLEDYLKKVAAETPSAENSSPPPKRAISCLLYTSRCV